MAAVLRLATAADAAAIHAIYAPIVAHTAISFEITAPTVPEVAQRITTTLAQHPWLVCADSDLLGYAYASPHRTRAAYQWAADVSVYTAPAAQRRGVARALYTALLALLRAQGYAAAFAGIALPNVASVACHEALGFRALGVYTAVGYKLGAWHDVGWWQHDLGPRPADPAPPQSIQALLGGAAWDAALAAGSEVLRGA